MGCCVTEYCICIGNDGYPGYCENDQGICGTAGDNGKGGCTSNCEDCCGSQQTTTPTITFSTTTTTMPTTSTTTSTTTTTTTIPDPDCAILCEGVADNVQVSNSCCTPKFCWCFSTEDYLMDCTPPGNLFCASTQACIENCSETDCCGTDTILY